MTTVRQIHPAQTVIFDCCHSASGTRTSDLDPTWLIRGVEVESPMDPDADRFIWKDQVTFPMQRGTQPPPHFLYAGLHSHVFLAACGAEEKAQEERGRGKFTQALLRELAAVGSEKLTYTELITRLADIPGYAVDRRQLYKDLMLTSFVDKAHNAKAITEREFCLMLGCPVKDSAI